MLGNGREQHSQLLLLWLQHRGSSRPAGLQGLPTWDKSHNPLISIGGHRKRVSLSKDKRLQAVGSSFMPSQSLKKQNKLLWLTSLCIGDYYDKEGEMLEEKKISWYYCRKVVLEFFPYWVHTVILQNPLSFNNRNTIRIINTQKCQSKLATRKDRWKLKDLFFHAHILVVDS